MAIKRFFVQLGKELMDDGVTDVGAMMAYYAILSLFPMLVFVLSIALLVLDPAVVREGVNLAMDTMPASVRELIGSRVDALINASSAGFAILGASLALWGASRGAMALMTALNVIFGKKETRGYIKRNMIAIAVTLGVAVLIVIALAMLVVGPYLGHLLADRFGLGAQFDTAWNVGRWVGAGLLTMTVWAIVYKFLANTDAPFRVFTPGAFVGVLGWLGISALFGLYLGHFNSYEATYGTLGGAIIFLTWLWLSNIALLVGAEINDVLADIRAHKSPAAAALSDTSEHEEVQPSAAPGIVHASDKGGQSHGHAQPA